jgi:ATP-binding cassette subfamily C protein
MVMVLYSDLSIGQMLAVFAYLWFMMTPVQEILGIQYAYHSARAALVRINQLMDVGLEPEYPTKTNPFIDHDTVSIETRHLTFSYLPDSPVLKDVNIQIKSGEKVALVGASGGGKTTLVQLLLGLYTPQSGDVLFDGQSVKEIGLDVVRDNVATVLQHPALFNDTIRANLTLGRDFTDEQLWHALEVAQLKETVTKLTDSLNTIVGRNGIRLSGGQRQRLAIARLVLSNPKVVILDEATSALDTDTEHQLHKALQGFLKGRTTLIVAHRLSAVKQADRALVFDNGQLVQDGSHQQLLKEDGLYASLYAEQETDLSTEIASA